MAEEMPTFPTHPGENASDEELITYYHKYLYKHQEIHVFLILRHGRLMSKTKLRRIIRRLGLRRNNVESSNDEIREGIEILYQHGFQNAGYRMVWKMLNVSLELRATHTTVRRLLKESDPEGVSLRQRNRLRRRMYQNGGPNSVIHIDGYDKLTPFGFPIHGAIDGFSRKILWLRVVKSNKNPYTISRLFLDWIIHIGRAPKIVRMDAGTENVVVKDIQHVLRCNHDDVRTGCTCYIVSRSTGNQRIEAFWSFIKKHFTVSWRNLFKDMDDNGLLSTSDDFENIRLWFTPVLQKELDYIKECWNSHRVRSQRDVECITGEIPDVMYYQSPLFGGYDHSLPLPCSVEELSDHALQLSVNEPERGCSEEFFERVSMLSGLDYAEFVQATSTAEAMFMYLATRDLLAGN